MFANINIKGVCVVGGWRWVVGWILYYLYPSSLVHKLYTLGKTRPAGHYSQHWYSQFHLHCTLNAYNVLLHVKAYNAKQLKNIYLNKHKFNLIWHCDNLQGKNFRKGLKMQYYKRKHMTNGKRLPELLKSKYTI